MTRNGKCVTNSMFETSLSSYITAIYGGQFSFVIAPLKTFGIPLVANLYLKVQHILFLAVKWLEQKLNRIGKNLRLKITVTYFYLF